MSENLNEETKVEETTTSASEETKSEESKEESKEETEDNSIDYKQELEKAKVQLGQAGHIIQEKKEEVKSLKDEIESPPVMDTEEFRKIAREEALEVHKLNRVNEIDGKLRENTKSDGEYLLAKFHYENSISVTGNDSNDIENSVFLANKKRYSSILNESMASAHSKDHVTTTSSGGSQKQSVNRGEKPTLSKEDIEIQKKFGLTDEQMTKGFDREASKSKAQAQANRTFSK